ncbi:unnamed protein product [Adineta steineri]|uniref:Uncharacterized protein n=1 Tax=Adineta steineri TaxID=433720 RepID=A0A815I0W5_9BILA|nr:unnamed protein product [Adineta steineri]CAF3842314.1 unnamed protein product [Adineta steineri]
MNRSSRLKDIVNKRSNLWQDSGTDTSSTSNNDNRKISTKDKSSTDSDTSNDENSEPIRTKTCCLICSILPNLSNINTCHKHLTSLTTPIAPAQVVYMMPPPMNSCPKSHCHCRSKSKRRYRSSSSSSSSSSSRRPATSSKSRRHRKKRSMTLVSSNASSQDDLFYSPDVQTQETTTTNNQQHRSNNTEGRLSPSLPPSTTINPNTNNNNLQKHQQFLITSILHTSQQQNTNEIDSMLKNTQNKPISQEDSPDIIILDSDSSCSSPIPYNQVVHVKDEGESSADNDHKTVSINMGQLAAEMVDHECPQPVILLERVYTDRYNPTYK